MNRYEEEESQNAQQQHFSDSETAPLLPLPGLDDSEDVDPDQKAQKVMIKVELVGKENAQAQAHATQESNTYNPWRLSYSHDQFHMPKGADLNKKPPVNVCLSMHRKLHGNRGGKETTGTTQWLRVPWYFARKIVGNSFFVTMTPRTDIYEIGRRWPPLVRRLITVTDVFNPAEWFVCVSVEEIEKPDPNADLFYVTCLIDDHYC